jgi:hypothetical protein
MVLYDLCSDMSHQGRSQNEADLEPAQILQSLLSILIIYRRPGHSVSAVGGLVTVFDL